MNLATILVALSVTIVPKQQSEKSSMIQILEAIHSPLDDVSCEYEGTMSFPQNSGSTDLGPNGEYNEYSGRYQSRSDGATIVDIYHRRFPKLQLIRETISMIAGKCVEYSRSLDTVRGGGQVFPAHFQRTDKTGSLARIVCNNLLMGYLQSDDWTLSSQPAEDLSGHRCTVITFTYNRNPQLSERFWIDLSRGGHPLKREAMIGGVVSHRMEDITLQSFDIGDGKSVWFPVSGIYRIYVAEDRTIGTRVTNLETYSVLRESLRFNKHLKDEVFSVNFRNGTLVTDKLRNVQYEFGRTTPALGSLTQAQTEKMLNDQLAAAEAQGDELHAASWERSDSGILFWSPWLITALSLSIMIILLIRNHTG